MTEVAETQDVNESEPVAPAEVTEEASQEQSQEPASNSKEDNMRNMGRKLEGFERRNLELERQNVELLRNFQIPAVQEQEVPPEPSLEKDDLITVEQSDLRTQRIVEEALAKRDKDLLPAQAKAKYSDYDQVVSPENIKRLIKEDPELEHDLSVARNPCKRAYEAVKRSKFYGETNANKENDQRIATNSEKPVSSNTIGKQRPLSHANAYAKGSKALFAEMQQYRKGSI